MSAHFVSATAHSALPRVRAALAATAIAVLAPAGVGQSGKGALEAVRPQLEALLDHPAPVLRGEAALALATTGDEHYYPAILKMASDRAEAARLRAIVALGYLAAPGSDSFLGDLLLSPGSRDPARAAAAALALGLFPDDRPAPAVDRFLQRVNGGSYKRLHASLMALLGGYMQEPHPSRAPALLALLEDDANKDPTLHRLALLALAPLPGTLPRADLGTWLESRDDLDRLGALEALRHADAGLLGEHLDVVESLAARDRSPRVRAAALTLLTEQRQLSSLELGVRALRSRYPEEVEAGVRAAAELGGGAIRSAMEARILDASKPELQAVMLRAYRSSTSTEFVDECLRLAADARTAEPVRVQAVALAARSGDRKSRAMLRRLFKEAEESGNLTILAHSMNKLDPTLIPLDRIYPPTTSTGFRLLPMRMAALFATGHAGGGPLLLKALESPDISSKTKAELVRVLRLSLVPLLNQDVLAAVPRDLREALR
jgi:hypothetical protein